MVEAAFLGSNENVLKVFGPEHFSRLAAMTDLYPEVIPSGELDDHLPLLADVEVLVSTWGMPFLTAGQLEQMPKLGLVLYGAGDVRGFAEPLVERGVRIVSAWRANAVPVAEFTLAHILLAGKRYLANVAEYRAGGHYRSSERVLGNRGQTVAILGCGAVGRALIEMLKPFEWSVVVYDPFLTEDLGVPVVSLEQAFIRGNVVTNHLANNAGTRGLITGALLSLMPVGATFINTGRGQTVVQDEFAVVFGARPDLTAVLDVTDPEPLPTGSPLWDLPNVFVSTHIAGSMGNELGRMADVCLDELERYLRGEPLRHEVPSAALVS